MIVGISGKKGSGKTTVANALMEDSSLWPARLDHLARPIKDICEEVLDIDPALLNGTDERKNTLTTYPTASTPSERKTVRQVMQDVGMYFRGYDPDVWVKALLRRNRHAKGLILVHDVRFVNEVRAIQGAGGKVLRLLRRGPGNDAHPSETALDGFRLFDAVVDNEHQDVRETVGYVRHLIREWTGL